jgi:hypothetical protein
MDPLLNNGCCTAASFAFVAQQRVYMPEYFCVRQDLKQEKEASQSFIRLPVKILDMLLLTFPYVNGNC